MVCVTLVLLTPVTEGRIVSVQYEQYPLHLV